MSEVLFQLYIFIVVLSLLAFLVGFVGLFISKDRSKVLKLLLYGAISFTICLIIGAYSIYRACGGKI